MTDPDIIALIAVLGDANLGVQQRSDALLVLKAEMFIDPGLGPHGAQFTQVLRDNATDPDPRIRSAALETLAQRNDGYAQNLLIQGLQNPSAALVPDVAALQLLGYDPHAASSTVARDVLANSNDPEARAAAAGLLCTDPTATALLAGLMADKAEFAEVRRASSASLKSLDPAAYRLAAQAIIDDDDDYHQIRSLSRTGLALLNGHLGEGGIA
jgi:HEAT repeat protein